ncbi:MAG: NAD(P)/FAD-dependent oxidoreductase, partial [Lentisphaeria bacterium]|nr:NAD(P)/FAD-dependent oxidoreductase [Lentisphaeria bacterium]
MSQYDIVVCGSGPAGLSAALAAAQCGKKVLLAERLNRPSVKLLASGGGRCNFSNNLPEAKFMESFGRNGRFMTDALRTGGRDWLLDFLSAH